jgi:hypothetical protein
MFKLTSNGLEKLYPWSSKLNQAMTEVDSLP